MTIYKRDWTVYGGELYGVFRFAIDTGEAVFLCYVMISSWASLQERETGHFIIAASD
jgi:hypothetical protein